MTHAVLTVGKPKAAYLAECLADYTGRLGPHGGCRLLAVRAAKGMKGRSEGAIMAEEGQRLLARLEPRDLVWALDVAGRPWSSEEWARRLDQARLAGRTRLVLVIGGPWGLAPEVLARADERVSLGPATMPHELAACVAAEQLYRAHNILAGTPYHRA